MYENVEQFLDSIKVNKESMEHIIYLITNNKTDGTVSGLRFKFVENVSINTATDWGDTSKTRHVFFLENTLLSLVSTQSSWDDEPMFSEELVRVALKTKTISEYEAI